MELQLTDFLDDQGQWHCIRCGGCCRIVWTFEPCLDRGDGVCKYLNEAVECDIYEQRPDVCHISWPEGHGERLKADACLKVREHRR